MTFPDRQMLGLASRPGGQKAAMAGVLRGPGRAALSPWRATPS